jgi:hypothetical protein
MKGYSALIEPEIYYPLEWDYDIIVRCLEVIRLALPEILAEGSESIEYDLVAVNNPFGSPYPVIGISDPCLLIKIDWIEINNKVNRWFHDTGLDNIKSKAENIHHINWERLNIISTFPT